MTNEQQGDEMTFDELLVQRSEFIRSIHKVRRLINLGQDFPMTETMDKGHQRILGQAQCELDRLHLYVDMVNAKLRELHVWTER